MNCHNTINRKIILWTTLLGGFFSSRDKWSSYG